MSFLFVIQTTVGRKNLDGIKDVSEILRFALDDNMIERRQCVIIKLFFLSFRRP